MLIFFYLQMINCSMTRDQLTALAHPAQSQKLQEEMPKTMNQGCNFFDRSDFVLNHNFPLQTFGSFHTLIIPELDIASLKEARFEADSQAERPYLTFLEDESPFFVMPYLRGRSESPEHKKVDQLSKSQCFELSMQSLPKREDFFLEQQRQSNTEINISSHLKQELKSFSNIGQSTVRFQGQKTVQIPNRGYLSKNVTKNIGKLLIKFIWKNRASLMSKTGADYQMWGSFIEMVEEWKKQNNITREFLITKWTGNSQEHKTFRVLSKYFFRKHCKSAILGSNIREKRIHIERVYKFEQAITEPKALDYLS